MCACVNIIICMLMNLGIFFLVFFHASTNVITIYNFGIMFIPFWVYRRYKFRSCLNHFCHNSQVKHFMRQTYFSLVQKTFQFVKSILYIKATCLSVWAVSRHCPNLCFFVLFFLCQLNYPDLCLFLFFSYDGFCFLC